MRGGIGSALTRRRRVRLDLLLGALVVAVVAAAILVNQGTATSQGIAASSPRPLTVAFAQAYVGYLDGRQPASSLPGAAARVRSIAAGAPTIPANARRGALKLYALRINYVRGALSARAFALGRDRAHTYPFSLVLSYLSGRWVVAYLVPPDVATIAAERSAPPTAPAGLERAAARFALAYAAYREGSRATPPAGLSTMTQQIAARRDPLASIGPTHVSPRLVSVRLGPATGGAAAASATLSDRGHRLRFDFDLRQTAGGWRAWGFPEAG
jgi:hypothetical protein